jgi:rubrerythrin
MNPNDQISFVERADELDASTLLERTVDNAFYASIRKRLLAPGGKLLVGPRGTGKTHQMRYVQQECIKDSSKPAAVYCSFSRYVRLEPLLQKSGDALLIFQSWVIAKIALAGHDYLVDVGQDKLIASAELSRIFGVSHDYIIKYISLIESRGTPGEAGPLDSLTIERLHRWFERLLEISARDRAIVLLDDAALSMTPEYLIEFFNLFQDLKTSQVSPKASVYPGTSQYGPRLHLRHDVQPINAWLSIEDPSYNDTMDQLLVAWDQQTETFPDGVVDLFKYASFGVPRVLLSMIRSYKERQWATAQQGVNAVIEEQVELMEAEYQSLAQKVPQFATVIAAGEQLFKSVVDTMTVSNRELSNTELKQLTVGIPLKEVTVLHGRMIRFLIEVGFFYPMTSVKHGDDRTYMRFIPHLAPLIHRRAFQIGSGFSAKGQVAFINRDKKTQPQRISMIKLIPDGVLKLDLAKCSKCSTTRLSEAQKFCHVCGAELTHKSRFEECMRLPISKLPITKRQREALTEERFTTIGDIIAAQDPASELRSKGLIGPKRSLSIVTKAQQYVDDYFS